MTSTDNPGRLLRLALRANAIFSTLSGLVFLLASSYISGFLGLLRPGEVIQLGVQLGLFAAWLFWLSFRPEISRWQVRVIIVLDILWVIGSFLLVLAPPPQLTVGGWWAIAGVAEVIGLFALLQFLGLRRLRRISMSSANEKLHGNNQVAPKIKTVLRWAGFGLVGLIALIVVIALAGATYQAIATARDESKYPPPGQLVDVGGHRLHIYCVGEGSPTVIIDTGTGGWSISYRHLQIEIAQDTRACTFDRAGMGWSDPGPKPRTSQRIVDELHTLLNSARLKPPFLLVGHSFGGYDARIFAARYPDEVAGMVLVEAAHEEQWTRLPPEVKKLLYSSLGHLWVAQVMSRLGLIRVMGVSAPPELSPELQLAYVATMLNSKTYDTLVAEIESVEQSAAQVAANGPLGSMPLVVISARNSFDAFRSPGNDIPYEKANQAWMEMQMELVALSADSSHHISETGTHRIHITEPALIVNSVREVLRKVQRAGTEAGIP